MDKSKINVLLIINGLGLGGAEKLLVDIVNRLDANKIQLTVVLLNSDKTLATGIIARQIDLQIFPRSWRYDLSPAWKIRKLLAEKKIDIIIPFAMFDFFFSRLATLGWKNYPHTNIYIHSTLPENRKTYFQNWIYLRLLRDADKLISVCNAQADFWSEAYRIPRKKFTTIRNGVDIDYFDYSLAVVGSRDICKEYNIPSNARVILQIAGFRDCKRHEDALEALKLISEQMQSPVYLMLVGSGSEPRALLLRRRAQDLGIAPNVIFCGQQQDVRPFIGAADVFTLTSDNETFSIAALEAMAMGVPCVLTDVGGAREMIVDGENGFLVESGNPDSIAAGWLKVFNQNDLFDKRQIRKMIVDRFSIQRLISDFEAMLGERDPFVA